MRVFCIGTGAHKRPLRYTEKIPAFPIPVQTINYRNDISLYIYLFVSVFLVRFGISVHSGKYSHCIFTDIINLHSIHMPK